MNITTKKKPLNGCVLCRDCVNKTTSKPIGVLTSKDMVFLGYSGCVVDGGTYLAESDRTCVAYEEVKHG